MLSKYTPENSKTKPKKRSSLFPFFMRETMWCVLTIQYKKRKGLTSSFLSSFHLAKCAINTNVLIFGKPSNRRFGGVTRKCKTCANYLSPLCFLYFVSTRYWSFHKTMKIECPKTSRETFNCELNLNFLKY